VVCSRGTIYRDERHVLRDPRTRIGLLIPTPGRTEAAVAHTDNPDSTKQLQSTCRGGRWSSGEGHRDLGLPSPMFSFQRGIACRLRPCFMDDDAERSPYRRNRHRRRRQPAAADATICAHQRRPVAVSTN